MFRKRVILILIIFSILLVGCNNKPFGEYPRVFDGECISQYGNIIFNGHWTNLSKGKETLKDCCCVDYDEFICHCPYQSQDEISFFVRG